MQLHEIAALMKIILNQPPNRSALSLRFLGCLSLTCFALPSALACVGNPDRQSAIVRISHLSEAPEAIQDVAKAIQGKNRAQILNIIIQRYGPGRDIGSGLDIEVWDVAGGSLTLHPLMGLAFTTKGRKSIWLLTTTNKALPNILGGFEMTALPDHNGMQNWLGDVTLRSNRTYRFKQSAAVADGEFAIQADNFFKVHPSGSFQIEFAPAAQARRFLRAFPTTQCFAA